MIPFWSSFTCWARRWLGHWMNLHSGGNCCFHTSFILWKPSPFLPRSSWSLQFQLKGKVSFSYVMNIWERFHTRYSWENFPEPSSFIAKNYVVSSLMRARPFLFHSRYKAICYPLRHRPSAWQYIAFVFSTSVLQNTPKFFEFQVSIPCTLYMYNCIPQRYQT